MKLFAVALLFTSAIAFADEATALRKIYAERDQELRASLEVAEDDLAQLTQKIASLKQRLGGEQKPDDGLIVVEVKGAGIFVKDVFKTAQELNEALRQVAAQQQNVHVRLTAAADVSWSKIRPALQACYDAKIWNFDFQISDAGSKAEGRQDGTGQPGNHPGDKPPEQ